MEDIYYEDIDTISSSDEIISRIIKTQTLNVLKETLENLLKSTTVHQYISTINYNILLIEDCYKIDMYKFQFKAITDMLQKDIKNLKEVITLQI